MSSEPQTVSEAVAAIITSLVERGYVPKSPIAKKHCGLALADGQGVFRIAVDLPTCAALVQRARAEGCRPEHLAARLIATALSSEAG